MLHVPGLSANLLSVHNIVNKGNSVLFDMNGCTIRNTKNETVANCQAVNGVYKIGTYDNICMQAKQTASAFTWHRRLGHINLQCMRKMRDGAVDGVHFDESNTEIENCEVCAMRKQARLPFKRSNTQSKRVLELIHSDVIGPMETKSMGNARYILTFVDDYSKKVFLYFLKAKSEVFAIFKEFKALVENQTGCTIKTLRTDNGKEYGSNE